MKKDRLNNIRLKKIAKLSSGKILDIGYAQTPNDFLEGEITGLDLNKNHNCKYKELIQSKFEDYNAKDKFDTIIAGEFIEHLENPSLFFRKCNQMLKEDGSLIVSTPTPYYWRTIIGNLLFRDKDSSQKDHLSIFAPRLLNLLASNNGFKVVKIVNAQNAIFPFNFQIIYQYRKEKK